MRVVDRMVAGGLVERHGQKSDGRARLLYLTIAGETGGKAVLQARNDSLVRAFSVLNEEEIATLGNISEHTVLLATFRGTQSITIHESQTEAETALMSFVDLHWAAQFEGESEEFSRSGDERLQRFFAYDRNAYVIAEADLSQLEEHIDAACPTRRE